MRAGANVMNGHGSGASACWSAPPYRTRQGYACSLSCTGAWPAGCSNPYLLRTGFVAQPV